MIKTEEKDLKTPSKKKSEIIFTFNIMNEKQLYR